MLIVANVLHNESTPRRETRNRAHPSLPSAPTSLLSEPTPIPAAASPHIARPPQNAGTRGEQTRQINGLRGERGGSNTRTPKRTVTAVTRRRGRGNRSGSGTTGWPPPPPGEEGSAAASPERDGGGARSGGDRGEGGAWREMRTMGLMRCGERGRAGGGGYVQY